MIAGCGQQTRTDYIIIIIIMGQTVVVAAVCGWKAVVVDRRMTGG